MITLYDLAAADPSVRFSPYCWRIKMALAHKGLDFETVPVRFTEKDKIAFSGQGLVPVIVDNDNDGKVVSDSWTIAGYLEETYANAPLLFPNGTAGPRFIKHWMERQVQPAILFVILEDLFANIDDGDKPYFRESREKRFGRPLEAVMAESDAARERLEQAVVPLAVTLKDQSFVGGEAPDYSDFIVMGAFMWGRCASAKFTIPGGDPVAAWFERMLDLHDGLARRAATAKPS